MLIEKYALTKSEADICAFASSGKTQAEIRVQFGYNTNALKQHLKAIYAKILETSEKEGEKYVRLLILLMKLRYEQD